MKITSSYAVELLHANEILRPTVEIYQAALAYLIDVVDSEWAMLGQMNALQRFNTAERLVHGTKGGASKYNFDQFFPKMPAYLRRAALQAAIGAVMSHHSQLVLYEESGAEGAKPTLSQCPQRMPTFYQPQMYTEDEDRGARIKIYRDGKWVWHDIERNPTDLNYLEKYWSHCPPSAPTLERRHGKYYLRYTFTEEIDLPPMSEADQRICAVWQGSEREAVCAILTPRGEVPARCFIAERAERDQLKRLCGRIKTLERNAIYSHFSFAKRVNDQLAIKVSHRILEFAKANGAGMTVFPRIEPGKQQYVGALKRLSYLRKTKVQTLTEHGGHRMGIRFAHVDGREADQHLFDRSDKAYERELSASYNIGARYFIREITKSLPARARSHAEANVPDIGRSASCTLSTLRALCALLEDGASHFPDSREAGPATGGSQERTSKNGHGPKQKGEQI